MDSTALAILLGTGLLSFLLGTLLRRAWRRRQRQKAEEALRQIQLLARQRRQDEPAPLNKGKRRRQLRERARQDTKGS